MPRGSTATDLSGVGRTDLKTAFAADGPLAQHLSRFQARPGQLTLAEAIGETLDTGGTLVAEAATGTGKTLAYLVPALLSGHRVILSTGTLNLQDQLFSRDLPLVLRALGVECRTSLLKGRSNYLCLHRLEQHLGEGVVDDDQALAHLQQVQQWSHTTTTGEISELADLPERSPVWPRVTSTVDNCLGTDCPRVRDCHLLRARRKAQDADVVVVNHHLLFADLALKQTGFGEVLPGADAVVLDEAHQVPEIATRFFSSSISAHQLTGLERDTLVAAGNATGVLKLVRVPVENLAAATQALRSALADLPERGAWELLAPAEPELDELGERLRDLNAALEPLADQGRELAQCAERSARLCAVMADLRQGSGEYVRWYTRQRRQFSLNLTPLNVAEPFQALRAELPAAWVMTSATLSVGGTFDHYVSRLGIDDPRTLIVDSPFDYASQARLWLPQGLPAPGAWEHTEALLQQVLPLLHAAGGRAFLLFTAHRALRRAADWLRANTDFELLVQEDAPRDVLLERFRAGPGRLLLGAASFWEGVDVPGEALSVVIIDKLPFAAPDDPVLAATLQAVRDDGGNPFTTIQLPQAVIALKQGAGRLIRKDDDAGVLVIGDPRLTGKPYGRLFLRSLPPMRRVTDRDEAMHFLRQQLPS